MVSAQEAIERVDGDHRKALQWFNDHAGTEVIWATMQSDAEETISDEQVVFALSQVER